MGSFGSVMIQWADGWPLGCGSLVRAPRGPGHVPVDLRRVGGGGRVLSATPLVNL